MRTPPPFTPSALRLIGPGLLVAATGVGAGDLATAAFAGSHLGAAVLWAVVIGAFFKFVLNEGLARWQLVTGDTLLEGAMAHLGRPFHIIFFVYFFMWSWFTASAMMSACGATAHAILPVFETAATGKIVFGILASLAGVVLVVAGGYRLFSKVMGACIAFMFVTVLVTVVLVRPDWSAVAAGLFVPRIPDADGQGLSWTVALMGGIGGTLTVLCYGYWIREEGRSGPDAIRACRIDLGVGYAMTALFGVGMVIIGSGADVSGSGSGLIVALADTLGATLGPVGKWCFLIGAWGAVFSSLLGVWQSVPYIFADAWSMARGEPDDVRARRIATNSRTYRGYLIVLAVAPMAALFVTFETVQKLYAVFGALFMPFLAFLLIYLNGRGRWVGAEHRNHLVTNGALVAVLVFFCWAGYRELADRFLG